MPQSKVSVVYHYGDKNFEKLLKEIIERKLANLCSRDTSNNDHITVSYGTKQE